MDVVEQIHENLKALTEYKPLSTEEREIAPNLRFLVQNFCPYTADIVCLVLLEFNLPQNFIFHLQYTRYGLTEAIPKKIRQYGGEGIGLHRLWNL